MEIAGHVSRNFDVQVYIKGFDVQASYVNPTSELLVKSLSVSFLR